MQNSPTTQNPQDFRNGDRVSHKQFGEGTVVDPRPNEKNPLIKWDTHRVQNRKRPGKALDESNVGRGSLTKLAAENKPETENNKLHINGKAIYIRNMDKALAERAAFQPFAHLPLGVVTENSYNPSVIRTNRGYAYIDAYVFAFAASGGEPIRFIGDKAVTNSLIAEGYLIYDATKHTLSPGKGLLVKLNSGIIEKSKLHGNYQAFCDDTSELAKDAAFPMAIDPAPSSTLPGNALVEPQDFISQDIENIERDNSVDATTREMLIDARVGQGNFRRDVMRQWGDVCAFSGCTTKATLRASHIKPWRECSNPERLDPFNGLLLVANLDALFDRGLISFEDSGQVLISPHLSNEEQEFFGLKNGSLRKKLTTTAQGYLAHHRKKFFPNYGTQKS